MWEIEVAFSVNSDVFIVSSVDTGEVKNVKNDTIYVVKRDSDLLENDHHEVDLKAIPWKGRIVGGSFYKIVTASKDEQNVRQLSVQAYRKTGGRIR